MTPDTPTPAERLRAAGAALSNCAFNLAQRNPGQFTARDIEALDKCRLEWDAASAAARAEIAQPATPEPTPAMLKAFQRGFQRQLAVRYHSRFKSETKMSAEEAGLREMLKAAPAGWLATQPATHVALTDERRALASIISAYDAYRRRGVAPAPAEYADVVRAIESARAALATQAAFSSSNTSNTLGDAAARPGLSAPLRSTAIPIATGEVRHDLPWKRVPFVPTPAMWAAWDRAPFNEDGDVERLNAWQAMLAAAPEYPGEGQ